MFKKHFFDLSLKIGLLAAFGQIVYFFVFYFSSTPPCDPIYYTDFWIPAIFIFLVVKFLRDKINGGKLRFWEGLSIGFQVSIWAGVASFVVLFIFLKFIDTSFFEQCLDRFVAYNESVKEDVIKQHGESSFNSAKEEIKQLTLSSVLLMKLFWGFLISFIPIVLASVFFRR